MRDATNETANYNKEIRELTQVTGLGAEEISRIVQVGDDWGIGIEQIRTSLEFANKNGLSPTIDNLAKLADEYVNTADKTEFAARLQTIFGRQYADMIPLLAQGGQALRNQADAQNDSLLATDASIKASRDYEVAVDDLNDTFQGLKYTIGNEVIPVMNTLLDNINESTSKMVAEENAWDKLKALEEAGLITKWQLVKSYFELSSGAKKYNTLLNEYGVQLERLIHMEEYNNQVEREEAIRRGAVIPPTVELTDETNALKEAQDRLNASFSDLKDVVNGRLGPEMEDFTKGQAELEQQMTGVRDAIDTAISQGYDPLGEKVISLKDDYDKLKEQFTTNADEHDEATKRILFDIMTQRAAIGGLTEDEMDMLQDIAGQWGLIDTATLNAMNTADVAFALIGTGSNAYAARAMLATMGYWTQEMLDNLNELNGKTYSFTVQQRKIESYDEYGVPTGGPGGQSGLDNFIVPSGHNKDDFPVWVQSGEVVNVTSALEAGKSGTGGGNTYNIYANGNVDGLTLYRQFKEALESDMRAEERAGIQYSDL